MIYDSIRFSIRDIMLFPGRRLRESLRYTIILTIVAFTSDLLNLPSFKNWLGGLAAIAFLFVISYIAGGAENGTFRNDADYDSSGEEDEDGYEGTNTSIGDVPDTSTVGGDKE